MRASYVAYLFDADGTLFDTRELIYRSFCAMTSAFGRPDPDRAVVDGLIGLPFPPQVDYILQPRDDAERERATDIYRARQRELLPELLRLFPGVYEGLRTLRRGGAKLAVVTSRSETSLPRFLRLLDGADTPGAELFDVLVTPETTTRHKPDPDPVLAALAALDVPADESVMIGDAEFDVECGARAGVDTVLVSWGGMSPERWPYQPGRIIHRFEELFA